MRASERKAAMRRLKSRTEYGDTPTPAVLKGRLIGSAEPRVFAPGGRTGSQTESTAPFGTPTRGASLAPISRTPDEAARPMSVAGAAEKVTRDRLSHERLTSTGEPKARPRPVEVPQTRTPQDRREGIVRVLVQTGRFTWIERIDRTTEMGEDALPYRRPVLARGVE